MTHRIKNLLVLGLILIGGLLIYTHMSPAASSDTRDTYSFNANPKVVMHTNFGDITLELFRDKAPKTVDNFIKLSRQGFYDGTLFHRVIKGFMIQGGDPNTKTDPKNWAIHGTGGPGYQFEDEINDQALVRGILAMANAGPGTNGSQFFIITAPATDWLNGKHTPFGKVISGMEVVDKIEQVKVNEVAHPLEDVVVEKVEVK